MFEFFLFLNGKTEIEEPQRRVCWEQLVRRDLFRPVVYIINCLLCSESTYRCWYGDFYY